MDRKSIIIVTISLFVILGLSSLVNRIYPPIQVPVSTLQGSNSPASNSPVVSTIPGSNTAPSVIAPAAFTGPEKTVELSNDVLVLHFSSHGGGLKLAEMKGYPSVIRRKSKDSPPETNWATLGRNSQWPVLTLQGSEAITGDNDFILTRNGESVHAEKTLTNGLRIIKEFTISSNYLIETKVRLENTSSQTILLPTRYLIVGTATPMTPSEDATMIGANWYNGTKMEDVKNDWFANRSFLGCGPSNPRSLFQGGAGNVHWTAVHNQFFTLAAIPATNAPQVTILSVPLANYTNYPSLVTNGLQTALTYPSAVIEPGKAIEHTYKLYAGPKDYFRLSQLGQKMENNLDQIMGFGGFFGFFSKLLLLSMKAVHSVGFSYALSIIVITIIIKLLFWPLTNASTKSMKRMQEMQPQMKAIAEKYKDDPTKKNQKTLEFMKEHKISPLGGCLPMLLQLPVLFGFYYMIRGAIELRGASFLWAIDLSQPDTIGYIAGLPINPMPLLMSATMMWQMGLTPTSPGMDPTQQKIMRWGMPIMMIFILYKVSCGLTLYWTVQNLLTIAQTKITKSNEPTNAHAKAGGVPVKKKK